MQDAVPAAAAYGHQATLATYRELGRRAAALDEVCAERHLVVRADRLVGDVARDVGAWLDRTWA